MPIVAIAVAAVTDFLAVDAFTAVAAGAFTVADAITVVGAVGATLSAVGVVTRDKGLQTVGMVLGGIGAIGSIASATGIIDGSQSLFGASSSAASDASGVAVDTANAANTMGPGATALGDQAATANSLAAPDIVNSLGGTDLSAINPATSIDQSLSGAAGNAGDAIANPVTGQLATPTLNVPSVDTSGLDSSLSNTATDTGVANASAIPPPQAQIPQGAGAAPAVPGVDAPTTSASLGTGYGNASGVITGQAGVPTLPGSASGLGSLGVAPGGSAGTLSSLWSFAKANPLVTMGILQSAGSFLSGATSTLTPAQVNALNAQAAANNAAASLTKLQVANMAQPIPVASRGPVPANVTGAPAGLINTPANANVTGSVAPLVGAGG